MLKHVVLLKFKKGASESAIADIAKDLAELPGSVPEIMEFESEGCGALGEVLRYRGGIGI